MKQGFAARRDNNFQAWYFLTSNAKGITQFWCLTDSNFFVLLDDLLSFCMPKKKVSKEKRHPASPSMAKSAIDPFRASQVTAREKLAFGSNSFPLNPLLAAVLSGAEGLVVAGSLC